VTQVLVFPECPCPYCNSLNHSNYGKQRRKFGMVNRFRCKTCGKRFQESYVDFTKENNPMWKGDKVGYGSLHDWIRDHKPKPLLCEECHLREPYDLANISGKYLRDINDFKWLCRKCHMLSDGRLKNLKQGIKKLNASRND
jgi:hypothetical protein